MSKKILLLNDKLTSESLTPVLFLFAPIALPVSGQGELVGEAQAEKLHYVTFVYSIRDKAFYLFEFNQMIYDGVLAYKARYDKMSGVEVLLSREGDGSLRMTVGNNHIKKSLVSEENFLKFSVFYDKLYDRYISKSNYYVSDFV